MSERFAGRVAFVTGAGSGIGRATALALAREGARVAVAGRRIKPCNESVARIVAAGGEAIAIDLEITDETSMAAAVAWTVERWGQLDVAVNCAATEGRYGRLIDQTLDDYAFTMDTNLRGVWLGMKHQLRQMVPRRRGAIVNVASNLGHVGQPNLTLYATSKSAVIGLTRAAALEYAREGIRINAVSPGPTGTELAARVFGSLEAFSEAVAEAQPLGRIARPEEVAAAILWAASDEASLLNGQSLVVDGGFTMQ